MNVGENIKKIRKEKGLQQKEVALEIGFDQSNYNKIENGKREPSIEVLINLATLFGITVDQIIHYDEGLPKEVFIEDKKVSEQIRLVQELDEDDQTIIFKMIDTMLTKKKFKDFFEQQFANAS